MFETVIAAMLKHKQAVFAAVAVTALIGYIVPPAAQYAQATTSLGESLASETLSSVFGGGAEEEAATSDDGISGDDNQEIDQTNEQDIEQDQESTQDQTQSIDQTEAADQDNVIATGENTASVSQSADDNDNKIGDTSAASSTVAEVKNKIKKNDADVKTDISSDASASSSQDNDNTNIANVDQDSSADDNTQTNTFTGGADRATNVGVQLSDQDQRAANLGVNLAANLDVEEDEDNEYGFAVNPETGEVEDCFPPSPATPPPFCG